MLNTPFGCTSDVNNIHNLAGKIVKERTRFANAVKDGAIDELTGPVVTIHDIESVCPFIVTEALKRAYSFVA